MRKGELLRKQELRSRSGPRRKPHKDPVTPEMRDYILRRDGGCIGPRVGMERECFGRLTIDHLYNAGTGKRGPSVPLNLSCLCGTHHFQKTVNAKVYRPLILAYILQAEDAA